MSGPFSNPCEPGTDAFFSGYVKGDLTGVCSTSSFSEFGDDADGK